MQALSARQMAFSAGGATAAARRRVAAGGRRGTAVVRADVGFCRDKISERLDMTDEIEGTSTVIFLGANSEEIPVECPKGGYILDAALDAGLELPFTCKAGICGCCVGRVADGAVDQSDVADLSFVLTDDEVASGLSLLCMSRPVSDVVKVETQSDWGYNLGSNNWKGPTGYMTGKKIEPLMGTNWSGSKEEEEAPKSDWRNGVRLSSRSGSLPCPACLVRHLYTLTLEGSSGSTPEASTPASLQTTPSGIRSPAGDGCSGGATPPCGSHSPLRHTLQLAANRLAVLRGRDGAPAAGNEAAVAAGEQAARAASTSHRLRPRPLPADHLLALADQAQLVQGDADVLRDGLRGARRQLAALQQQLVAMQRQALRQQQLLHTLLVEQECEVKLARSEAEAYRTAARARTAAVGTLQSAVASLQADKARLEGRVRQLAAALQAAATQQSALAAHDRQRQRDAAALQQLASQLQKKAAAVDEAQAGTHAALALVHQTSSAADALQQQLGAARDREAALAADVQRLQQAAAAEAGTTSELRRELERLQGGAAAAAQARSTLQAGAADAKQRASGLQAELEEQRRAAAALAAQHEQLAQRAVAAEAEAGSAAGQLVAACEENAALAEQLAQAQAQVEDLGTAQVQHAKLAAAVHHLTADKAALVERLAEAEAEAASLRRMVRVLKQADSAAPSPAAAGGLAAAQNPYEGAGVAGSAARPRRKKSETREDAAAAAAAAEKLQQSDSGSSDEAEERQLVAAAATPQQPSGACLSCSSDGGSGSSSPRTQRRQRRQHGGGSGAQAQFWEEQVQSLTGALRRLQRRNRELAAQLGAAQHPQHAGSTVLAAAEPADALAVHIELSGLAAENAALRRQLEDAEEEAGRAQWRMEQQQAEARALHAQVVEVMAQLSDAGLAPALDATQHQPQQPPLPPAPKDTQQQQHHSWQPQPKHAALPGGAPVAAAVSPAQQHDAGDVLLDLQQAMAEMQAADDDDGAVEQAQQQRHHQWRHQQQQHEWQRQEQQWSCPAAAAYAESDGGSTISDVFDGLGAGPAGGGGLGSSSGGGGELLRAVAAEIPLLASRNAALQPEINGLSAASSRVAPAVAPLRPPPPPQQQQQGGPVLLKSQPAVPPVFPTPDLSQTGL